MADNLIPPMTPQDGDGDDCSTATTQNKTTKDQSQNVPTTDSDKIGKLLWLKFVLEIIIGGSVGTGIWVFGEHLVSHGHTKSGDVFNYLAFVCYFATAALVASNFWKRKLVIWTIFSIFCIVMAAVFAISSQPPKPEEKPRLSIILDAVNGKMVNIVLTNDLSPNRKTLDFMNTSKVLAIPIGLGTSNVTLEFSLINRSGLTVSDAEVILCSLPALGCLKNDFWEPSSLSNNEPGKGWTDFCRKPLYPGDRLPLGPLEIPFSAAQGQLHPVTFFVRANKDIKPAFLSSFMLMFSESMDVSNAGLYQSLNIQPTNSTVGIALFTNKKFLWFNKVIAVTNFSIFLQTNKVGL